MLGEMDDWRIAMKPVLPVCLDVKTILHLNFPIKKKKNRMGKDGNAAESNQWSVQGGQYSCALTGVVLVLPPEIWVPSGQQPFPAPWLAADGGLVLASAS